MAQTVFSPDEWLVHSALVGGLVLLAGASLMLCTRQPARRQRLGELALASSLLGAGLCVLPAWLPYSLPLWQSPAEPAAAALVDEQAPLPTFQEPRLEPLSAPADWFVATEESWELPAPLEPSVILDPNAEQPVTSALPSATAGAEAQPAATPIPSSSWEVWLAWIVALYLLAVACLLMRCLVGYLALRRLWRAGEPPPGWVRELFANLTRPWQVRPRLAVSPRLSLPVSFGLWRPTILLPPSFCRPEAREELRCILIHELTHLQRRDAWSCLLLALAQAVFFYVPWFWWLRRQVRLCQEYVADAAAASLSSSEDYAQYLVSLAPASIPAGAHVSGVLGNSSDLFRRIAMLLNSSQQVESRCPRGWLLAAATGFLAAAMLVSGISLRAEAAPPKRPAVPAVPVPPLKTDFEIVVVPAGQPRAFFLQDKATPAPAKPDNRDQDKIRRDKEALARMLKDLAQLQNLPPEQAEQIRKQLEEAQKRLEEALKKAEEAQKRTLEQFQLAERNTIWLQPRFGLPDKGRLGARVAPPSETLASQLDLPKGQGLVIEQVTANSAADKVGLQPHDILVELNGKPVSNNAAEFGKALDDIKPNQAVTAAVLRKGKKTEIKGLTLPEAKEDPNVPFKGRFLIQPLPGGVQIPNIKAIPFGAGGNVVMTTVFRQDDRFTTRYQEGALMITVTGTIAGGKAKVSDISIQDGGQQDKYESLDKVPERYRDKAKSLIEMSEKGGGKVEIKP